MSRRKKSPFDGVETAEQLADALQKHAGTLTVAQMKSAALIAKLRGWDISVPVTADESQDTVCESLSQNTGTNLQELRQDLAKELERDTTARDWILKESDDIFCERVERFMGIRPDATQEQRDAFNQQFLIETLEFVAKVRDTVGDRIVSVEECLRVRPHWSTPRRKAALEIVCGWQTPTGFDSRDGFVS